MEPRRDHPERARERAPVPFVPPRLTPLGRVQDITLGTGSTFTDGFFGS